MADFKNTKEGVSGVRDRAMLICVDTNKYGEAALQEKADKNESLSVAGKVAFQITQKDPSGKTDNMVHPDKFSESRAKEGRNGEISPGCVPWQLLTKKEGGKEVPVQRMDKNGNPKMFNGQPENVAHVTETNISGKALLDGMKNGTVRATEVPDKGYTVYETVVKNVGRHDDPAFDKHGQAVTDSKGNQAQAAHLTIETKDAMKKGESPFSAPTIPAVKPGGDPWKNNADQASQNYKDIQAAKKQAEASKQSEASAEAAPKAAAPEAKSDAKSAESANTGRAMPSNTPAPAADAGTGKETPAAGPEMG